ncbi:MAG: hypothetical protein ACJAX3_002463 [Patiriisocius sp.]|jgi:hypothetical protein
MSLNTPILFIIFNRPETTRQVFSKIRVVKPRKLYVAADGPRSTHPEDLDKCESTRALIEQVDWDCQVEKLYRENNLGCKQAVSQAINWFFEKEEMGIILEDDCLPSPSFFLYCEKLLIKYKYDENIFSINGCNLGYNGPSEASYSFTRFVNMWGWATWRRSARKVDYEMAEWKKNSNKYAFLRERLKNEKLKSGEHKWYLHWLLLFNQINKIDTWDYQWIYTCLKENSLCIFPQKNLINNLGFGADATHTIDAEVLLANLQAFDIQFPLVTPETRKADTRFEEECLKINWEPVTYSSLLKLFLRGILMTKKY